MKISKVIKEMKVLSDLIVKCDNPTPEEMAEFMECKKYIEREMGLFKDLLFNYSAIEVAQLIPFIQKAFSNHLPGNFLQDEPELVRALGQIFNPLAPYGSTTILSVMTSKMATSFKFRAPHPFDGTVWDKEITISMTKGASPNHAILNRKNGTIDISFGPETYSQIKRIALQIRKIYELAENKHFEAVEVENKHRIAIVLNQDEVSGFCEFMHFYFDEHWEIRDRDDGSKIVFRGVPKRS